MQEGEIFQIVGDWLFNKLPKRLHNPIFECPACMVFWHGTYLYWIIWGKSVLEWIVVVISGVGLNAIIIKFFPHDEIKKS